MNTIDVKRKKKRKLRIFKIWQKVKDYPSQPIYVLSRQRDKNDTDHLLRDHLPPNIDLIALLRLIALEIDQETDIQDRQDTSIARLVARLDALVHLQDIVLPRSKDEKSVIRVVVMESIEINIADIRHFK
jgi:hypothetical protein